MSKQIIAMLLLTVFLVMLVSAGASAGDLKLELKTYPATVEHNQGSFTITFDLTNLNKTFPAENLKFYATQSANAQGTWQLPTLTSVTADSKVTLSAVFNLQPYQSGDFVAAIGVNGTINSVLQNAIMNISRGKMSINTKPSLEITDVGTLSPSQNSTTFKLKNTGNENLAGTITLAPLEYVSGKKIEFILNQSSFSLDAGREALFKVSADIPSDLELGEYTSKINANSTRASAQANLKVVKSYCEFGAVGGDLKIYGIKDKSSDTDWKWRPLDEVEIEVKIENNGDTDEDVTVQIDLYDTEEKDIIDFEEGDNEQTLAIDEDDSEIFTFNVQVPVDVKERTYRLYVKAYIDGGEDEQCVDTENSNAYISIDIEKDSRDVVIDKISVPSAVQCSESAEIYAQVFNIGSTDEDKVKLRVYNKELGIDQESSAFGLDEGDSEKKSFTLLIPQNATEKTYNLELTAFYNYRKSGDEYRDKSDVIQQELKVSGNCKPIETRAVAISAVLESEARAGKDMSIKATITNTGDVDTTYTLAVSGNEAWSSLKTIEPATITLKPSESKDVLVTLSVSKGVTGDRSFIIKALYNGKTTEQPVSVFIEKSGILTGLTIGEAIGENWLIWLIAAINIILIILIIVVAIRASRK